MHHKMFYKMLCEINVLFRQIFLLINKGRFSNCGNCEWHFILDFKVVRRFFPMLRFPTLYVVRENPNAKILEMGS